MENDTRRYEPPRDLSPQELRKRRIFTEQMLRVRIAYEQVKADEVDRLHAYTIDFVKKSSPWETVLTDKETGETAIVPYGEFYGGLVEVFGRVIPKDEDFKIIHRLPEPATKLLRDFVDLAPKHSLQVEQKMYHLPSVDNADLVLFIDRYLLPNDTYPMSEVATIRRFDAENRPHLYQNRLA